MQWQNPSPRAQDRSALNLTCQQHTLDCYFLLNDSVIRNLHNNSSGQIPVWEADYSPVHVLPGFHTLLQGILTG